MHKYVDSRQPIADNESMKNFRNPISAYGHFLIPVDNGIYAVSESPELEPGCEMFRGTFAECVRTLREVCGVVR